MTKYLKYIFVIGGVLVAVLFVKSCDGPEPVLDTQTELPTEDVLHVGFKNNVIEVKTATDSEVRYIPDAGSGILRVKRNGDIDIQVKSAGFTFTPILGLGVTRTADLDLGLQVAYWNRFELLIGGKVPHYAGFIGLGYRLDQIMFLQNTTIYVQYTTRREPGMGIAVRF